MSILRKPPSLTELRARAQAELAQNPTITVYTMHSGVALRWPVSPVARTTAALAGIIEKFEQLGIAATNANDAVRQMRPMLPMLP